MSTLADAKRQLRQCLVASKNRRDLGNNNPNFPDTDRLTLSADDFTQLSAFFRSLQSDPEFGHLYPANHFRFETATSGSNNRNNVHDLKISPIQSNNASGTAIFNYHIQVQ